MTEYQNTAHPDRDWWTALWGDPADTLDALGIDGGPLVDLCCGDGYFSVEAARRCSPVYGVDLEAELLAPLDEAADAAGVDLETIEADARDLESVIPEPVDTVLLANTLHGVPDKIALADVVHDTLVENGRFVIINWFDKPAEATTVLGEPRGPPRELRMTPNETRQTIEPSGFESVETVELNDSHYGIVFERVE